MAFKSAHDDYSAILLGSRLPPAREAFVERLHERVRTELWAYAPAEDLGNEALIAESIAYDPRGYPACPDHTEKRAIWELLDVRAETGIELT